MVAFASDWRISDKRAASFLSPAVIVMRYKQVMGTADQPEMPHGVTLQQMLATVVKAEEAICAMEDQLERFTTD